MPPTPASVLEHLDRQRKPVVLRSALAIACFCLFVIGVHVWSLWASRLAELESTATTTANMARALASHAERSIKIADGILGELVERAEHGELAPQDGARLHARMRHIAASSPEIQELFVYGADGRRLATSLPALLKGSNADREFFIYHRSHADRATRIGKPIRSRSSGVLTIPLTRRIEHPDGSFAGVAMASLKLDFFGRFYDSFDVGRTGTIILAIDDGTLLYRRPFSEAMVGTDISGGPVVQLYRKAGPVGTAMLVARIDGIERLYSYRHLDGVPLLVAIAQSKEEILAEWWIVVIKMSAIVAGAVALLAWGGLRLARQLRVREALEDELRRARATLEARNLSLQELADSDGLTGLANRRHFEGRLAAEHERARRSGQPCALILLDVDYFKKYNDRYGHVAGDACLRAVAGVVAAQTRRPADLAARYGGEEFAVLLPDTDLEGACAVAQNIRAALAQLRLAHADHPGGNVTVSLGVHVMGAANCPQKPVAWVEAADALLYEAKAAGRDRYVARAA